MRAKKVSKSAFLLYKHRKQVKEGYKWCLSARNAVSVSAEPTTARANESKGARRHLQRWMPLLAFKGHVIHRRLLSHPRRRRGTHPPLACPKRLGNHTCGQIKINSRSEKKSQKRKEGGEEKEGIDCELTAHEPAALYHRIKASEESCWTMLRFFFVRYARMFVMTTAEHLQLEYWTTSSDGHNSLH